MPITPGFHWQVPPERVFGPGYSDYVHTKFLTGRRVAEARAEEAKQWMKDNAPWQDVTGDARRGLDVDVVQEDRIFAQLIFHHDYKLNYPIYLELANQGRFAIIAPAIDYWGPRLWRDVQSIMNLGHAARG